MMSKIRYFAALTALAALAAIAVDKVPAADDLQPKLIETLKSGAQPEKAAACKQLAICGNAQAVPALAALLPDPELSSWARIALEVIPGPEADATLREALGKLQGRLLMGVVNSLGVRHDAKAVEPLTKLLKSDDVEVACIAAVTLGRIGGQAVIDALQPAIATGPAPLRSAAAEGLELCAEQLLAQSKPAEALKIYESIRKADLPVQRVLEATRGAILAQGAAGVPLLVEQLQSTDKARFALGLRVARQLAGREVTDALLAQLAKASPERKSLLILALADRGDAAALPAVLEAAKSGPDDLRATAIRVLKRLGNADCVDVLLQAASDPSEEVARAAMTVLADMPGTDIDKLLAAGLERAEGKQKAILIELAGRRPVPSAVPALLKAADDADAQVRQAAIAALGATIEMDNLPVLIQRVANPQNADDAPVAEKALSTACQRMPDREACAAKLVAAMASAPTPVKCRLLEILSDIGGAKALEAVAAGVKDADPEIQDVASRLLGAWMDVDAGPVLLDLARNAADEKYKIRAMRGYIRLVRQFAMSDADRAKMCRTALETAHRTAEKKLVLEVMGRNPSADMLSLAMEVAKVPELKGQAVAVAMLIAQKTGSKSPELQKALAEMGQGLVKIEIIKAEYGAGTSVKDVTTILRKHVHDFPVIVLPSPSYNATFGGDPAPGKDKQLKVQYRMAGKAGEASFAENASIQLPRPKK